MFAKFSVVVLIVLGLSAGAIAAPGDTHYIKGNTVNIRSGPGTSTDVVAKLNNGYKLTEIGRSGRWINVTLAKSGGKTGWIRQDLVSAAPSPVRQTTPSPAPPEPAALASAQGVANALRVVPRAKLRDGLRAAIWNAGFPCPGGVIGHREVMVRAEGAYYVAACKNKLRYSVLIKPDGRMGTRVVSCESMERLTGVDPCAQK